MKFLTLAYTKLITTTKKCASTGWVQGPQVKTCMDPELDPFMNQSLD